MAIKKDDKIEKCNCLNEMKSTAMTLQEVRFLTIYMSKINARQPETRQVTFSLDDFRKIMDIKRLTISNIEANTTKLLQKVAKVTTNYKTGEYEQFQLFKQIKLTRNELGEYFVTIDCHDMALPMFFDFKKNYFTYELWNALKLNSPNQIRMYEILKQHEKQKEWTVSVQELRQLLFIANNEYPRFQNFKVRVLDSCQQALAENTDIKFEYELIKKGAKVIKIKFIINKNDNYIDPLSLQEFIDIQDNEQQIEIEEIQEENNLVFKNETLELLSDACDHEFIQEEIQVLLDLIISIVPQGSTNNLDTDRYNYLRKKYNEMNMRKPKASRFGYLKTIIKSDIEEV